MADDLDGGDARAQRLDARLARLETRLEMLETAIRAEVGRIQLVAENMSSLTSDLQGTVGGTRNLIDLVNDVGDRLTLLHTLEATVSSASQTVADEVRGHLEETGPVLQRVNGQMLELAARLEQVASHTSAIAAHLTHMRSEQSDPAAAIAPLFPRVDQLAEVLGRRIDDVVAAIEELRTAEPDADNEADDALAEEFANRLTLVADSVTSMSATIEELAGAMHREGARTSQRLDELAGAIERIERAAAAMRESAAAPAQPAAPAEPINLAPEIDARLNDVLSGLAFAVEQIEANTRADQANATRINERLDQLASELNRTRADLDSLRTTRVVEPQRSDDLSGAGAALLASAAAALSRLEGRIESEFDIVERQTEALGSLLAQTIEAIERVENQIVGVQPITEKMRAAAAHTLELLRTNRRRGGPPQLNR